MTGAAATAQGVIAGATRRITVSSMATILPLHHPNSAPPDGRGCTRGATITFRVGGRRVANTAVNDLHGGSTLDLTLI